MNQLESIIRARLHAKMAPTLYGLYLNAGKDAMEQNIEAQSFVYNFHSNIDASIKFEYDYNDLYLELRIGDKIVLRNDAKLEEML